MSRVFVATETALGRSVVVKVLPPELTGGVNIDRFRREILLAAKLQHPHIVPVLASGEMDGIPFYTMPLVEGRSLRARLDESGALPIVETIRILSDVAMALAYAHDHGVVHRDIKPDNVLLCGGAAVVTDFGIAKALSESKVPESGATLTQVGTSLGTPAYMAPEQAAADPATDHRADTYAFGCMAYELLTGRPPFTERTPQKLLAAQMGEAPRPVTELRPDTPPALAALVMRCLEKDADNRPQKASDLARVLDTVTTSDHQRALPTVLLGGRQMIWKALAAYAVAFLAVAIVAKAAIVAIGLPDWVQPGALIVMALGLPVILFTGYVHYVTHREAMEAATLTPGASHASRGTLANIAVRVSPHMSWRGAMRGGAFAVTAFVLLVAGFMTLRALGIGPAGSLLAAGKLTGRDRIVVADFRVLGGDSSLANVVTEAVRTGLGESPLFTILAPSAIAAAIQRMQRSPASHFDVALARDVAIREGAKAIVTGEVTPLGAGFVIVMRLVTADSGSELASFHETADSPKELLPTLDKLTRSLRGKAGESLKNVHADPPLEQVTTSSLDALRKYVEGSRANDAGQGAEAVPLLLEAVALDTTFAAAYRKLAVAYRSAGFPREKADSASAKAYRYRDRLTERERDMVLGYYFTNGPVPDRPKGVAAYEALLKRYPNDAAALNNLATVYGGLREFARAESLYRRGIAVEPTSLIRQMGLSQALIAQGKLDAADSLFTECRKGFPGSEYAVPYFSQLVYARGDLDSTIRLVGSLRQAKSATARAQAQFALQGMAMLRGHLIEATHLLASARVEDSARGVPPQPLLDSLYASFLDIWMREQPARGVQRLDAALARTPLQTVDIATRPYFVVAGQYALAGRPERAHAVLAQYNAEVRDTSLRREREPEAH